MVDKIIYIADMDITVKQYLKQNLEACNYEIKLFDNGERLVWECHKSKPDFIILDVRLHAIDGLGVCRILRQDTDTRDIPILFLSEMKEEFDIILGLEMGADDYMIKPFSIRELQSRIKSLFRRTKFTQNNNEDEKLRLNGLEIDVEGRTVYNCKLSTKFSKKEFELLMFLISNTGIVLSRAYILEIIWGPDYLSDNRTVDVHIRNIRRKLYELDCTHSYIECERRSGYRFNVKVVNKKVG